MKPVLSIVLALTVLAAGCHKSTAQNPPTPVTSCPMPNTTTPNYTAIGSPVSTVTTVDIPPVGAQCYLVETVQGAGNSGPSNVVMVTFATGNKQVNLSWTAPAADGNSLAYTYQLYRAVAVTVTPTAPLIQAPTVALNVQPAFPMRPVSLVAQVDASQFR